MSKVQQNPYFFVSVAITLTLNVANALCNYIYKAHLREDNVNEAWIEDKVE